ncbi:alpha/beta hydrolase [Spongiactinospora rosea]|uniref:Alpha/beta hydrolase n=1 Tax=Spongiactinospora rosea TaxID=2248750 RepID=A0A366M8U5_9ACTN|nr:alpha/beta fold hydrolase [Spongiactinospora rosea]RBQ22130.1 alpha/beta hydrolase [Spongiactinospora rosea]
MSVSIRATAFRSLDGLNLRGTLVMSTPIRGNATVLVHGGGVNREEGGFYERLANGLAEAGISSLRFDLRGHGESEGRQEDLTLSGVTNDIRAAVEHIRAETGSSLVNLIGASFGGGITAFYASRYANTVGRLILFNPLLNYKKRFVEDKPYWRNDHIDEAAGRELATQSFVSHSPTFKLGRPLLNEVFYLQPHRELRGIISPTLVIHGTGDTFIPVQSSRDAVSQFGGETKLIEIDGAQHGFAMHDDPQYRHPRSQEWQAYVIRTVAEWLQLRK